MLEEYGKAAEERRQTETTHIPLAASVHIPVHMEAGCPG